MNKKLFILLLLPLFILASCGKSSSALRYNDKIINIQSKVINKIIILTQSMKSGNAELMQRRLTELQDQTTLSADELSNLEEFEGGDELYNSAMDLFEFYESVCKNEFQEMIEILSRSQSGITAMDIRRMQELQGIIQKEEGELDRKLLTAQQNFARLHGFRIGKNKLQKKIDNL